MTKPLLSKKWIINWLETNIAIRNILFDYRDLLDRCMVSLKFELKLQTLNQTPTPNNLIWKCFLKIGVLKYNSNSFYKGNLKSKFFTLDFGLYSNRLFL